MPNLEIVETRPRVLAMKLEKPFPLGFGTLEYLPRVLYSISAIDGNETVTGNGEASIDFPFAPYDAWDIYWALKTLRLVGRNPLEREAILNESEFRGRELEFFPAAFAALNMAVDDLYGKLTRQSVLDIYGQKRESGKALASISFKDDMAILISEIEGQLQKGFIPKPKVGRGLAQDFETISGVARYCADRGVSFVLDFNAQYSVVDFEKLVKRLRQNEVPLHSLLFLEQPTQEEQGISGLVAAKKTLLEVGYDVPVMADESFVTLEDAKECVSLGVLLNFKIHKVGGIYVAREIEGITRVTSGNIVGGTFPTAIARTYDQQAAAVLNSTTEPGDGWEPSTDWFKEESHLIDQAFGFNQEKKEFFPQRGFGLGVTVNEEKVKSFEIEDPAKEYHEIRKDRDGKNLRIQLKPGEKYSTRYYQKTGRRPDWNI